MLYAFVFVVLIMKGRTLREKDLDNFLNIFTALLTFIPEVARKCNLVKGASIFQVFVNSFASGSFRVVPRPTLGSSGLVAAFGRRRVVCPDCFVRDRLMTFYRLLAGFDLVLARFTF